MKSKQKYRLAAIGLLVIGLFGVRALGSRISCAQTTPIADPPLPRAVAVADESTAYPAAQADTASLTITKDVTPTFVTETNAPVTYTITFTNDGDVPLTNVVITDELSTSVSYSYALSPQCSGPGGGIGGTVTCDVGELPTGGSESVRFVVLVATPGLITNVAEADADQIAPVQSEAVEFYYSSGCVAPYGLDFTTVPEQPIAGEPVVFSAIFNEHTDRPLYYDWNLDGVGGYDRGGYGSAGNPVTYTYAVSGTYHVQLDVANACGVRTYIEDVVVLGEPELAWESIQHTLGMDSRVITPVLTLTNTGTADLHWTVDVSSTTTSWLSLTTGSDAPTHTLSSTTAPSGREIITGSFDTTGLAAAVYTAQLLIASDAATATVPVTLTVAGDDELMAHYPFDGDAADASGNGNHGTVHGATLTTGHRGYADGAYRFDGEDDYILVPDSDTLDLTTSATFALWVKVDPEIDYGVYGGPHLFSKGATHGALWADYAFKLNQNRSLFEITKEINTPHNAVFPAIPEGRWVHLAIIYRDGTAMLYQDGLTVTQPISTHAAMRVSDQPLYIGHRYDNINAGRFQGMIDNLRIYNRALSEEEIRQLVRVDCDRRIYLPLTVR